MNSNIFERKAFIDGNYIAANEQNIFSSNSLNNNLVLSVNLLRATANETDMFKSFLTKQSFAKSKSVIFDLRSCSFVDSSFLSCIICFNNENKANVKLVVADRRQLTIFKITKLDSIFKIYTSIDNAVAALSD